MMAGISATGMIAATSTYWMPASRFISAPRGSTRPSASICASIAFWLFPVWARFGPHATSDFSPQCAQKRTCIQRHRSDQIQREHRSIHPSSSEPKAPDFLKSLKGKLGDFRSQRRTRSTEHDDTPSNSLEAAVREPVWSSKVRLGSAGFIGGSVVVIG
jgi:hypothetical protein